MDTHEPTYQILAKIADMFQHGGHGLNKDPLKYVRYLALNILKAEKNENYPYFPAALYNFCNPPLFSVYDLLNLTPLYFKVGLPLHRGCRDGHVRNERPSGQQVVHASWRGLGGVWGGVMTSFFIVTSRSDCDVTLPKLKPWLQVILKNKRFGRKVTYFLGTIF